MSGFVSSVFGGFLRQDAQLRFGIRITLCCSEPIVTEYQHVLQEIGAGSDTEARALIDVFV